MKLGVICKYTRTRMKNTSLGARSTCEEPGYVDKHTLDPIRFLENRKIVAETSAGGERKRQRADLNDWRTKRTGRGVEVLEHSVCRLPGGYRPRSCECH